MPIQTRTALVTGGARRLGRTIAEALVADGWVVVVHARDVNRAAAAARDIGALGGVGGDLRDHESYQRIVDDASTMLGDTALDLLVNNAGSFVQAEVESTSLDQWNEAFDVNARAPFFLLQCALPVLERRRGMVVNISDHAATEHWASHAAHSAGKAALESLTISAAKALLRRVRVNAISPGAVLLPDDADPDLAARLAARDGLGSPDQVVTALRELITQPERTGEVVALSSHGPG